MFRFELAFAILSCGMASPAVEWSLHSSHHDLKTSLAGIPYTVKTDTYYSQPIALKAGHMVYTAPERTPLVMPNGTYAVTSFFGDIVDDQHLPVPLSDVYDHHWIAISSKHQNQLCRRTGGLGNYVFGIGAESRNNPVTLPEGYAYVVEDGAQWGGNIHLLRTEGLAGNPHKAAKECNECYYGPNKGAQCTEEKNGTFACCGERDYNGTAFCDTSPDLPLPVEKIYHLRYNVTYTRSIDTIIPLQIGVMSAPDCLQFYGVYRNDTHPVDTQSYSLTLPYDVKLLLATGHMHTGALNVTMSVNGELACASQPRYGTEDGVPGNERGYLVEVSQCIDASSGGLDLKAGDVLTLEANYYVGSHDSRLLYSDGTHLNVMGYMYVAYTAAKCHDKCVGKWGKANCEGTCPELVKKYQCAVDYCPTCKWAGWCDETCGYCKKPSLVDAQGPWAVAGEEPATK